MHFTTGILLTFVFLTLQEFGKGFIFLRFTLHVHRARIALHSYEVTSKVEVQEFLHYHEYISRTELEGPVDTREGSPEPGASSRLDPKRPGYVTAPDLAAVWAAFLARSIRFAPFPASPECRET